MLQFLKNTINIIFPKVCAGCNTFLEEQEHLICIQCRHQLAVTNFHLHDDNIVAKNFYGKCTITNASSMLIFHKDSIVQNLIHHLKYKGQDSLGTLLGKWYGAVLVESNWHSTVDMVIPVPIHPRKLRRRGYNQVTNFGKEIANTLNTEYFENILIRTRYTNTQTFKTKRSRQYNKQIFKRNPEVDITGKHILLVDDVITTGATIEACVKALQENCDVKVSVVAIAYTV